MKQKYFFCVFCVLLFIFGVREICYAQYKISLTTIPPFERIGPDKEPVKFQIVVMDANGKPAKNVRVWLILKSPQRGRFFSTDFPWVENSTLLELESVLNNGNFTFDYLIPIRGTYTLKANVLARGDAAPVEKIFTFKVYENADEMRKLYLLAALLFVIGFFAGIFLRRSKTAVTAMLFIMVLCPSTTQAHNAMRPTIKVRTAKRIFAIKQAGRTLSVTLKPDHGIVGKITHIEAEITGSHGNTKEKPMVFVFTLTNAEDKVRVFKSVIYTPQGKTTQGIQTTDGANHIVTVDVFDKNTAGKTPDGKPLASFQKEIEVEAFAPPKTIVARTLIFLLLIMALGMLTGSLVEGMRKIQ